MIGGPSVEVRYEDGEPVAYRTTENGYEWTDWRPYDLTPHRLNFDWYRGLDGDEFSRAGLEPHKPPAT